MFEKKPETKFQKFISAAGCIVPILLLLIIILYSSAFIRTLVFIAIGIAFFYLLYAASFKDYFSSVKYKKGAQFTLPPGVTVPDLFYLLQDNFTCPYVSGLSSTELGEPVLETTNGRKHLVTFNGNAIQVSPMNSQAKYDAEYDAESYILAQYIIKFLYPNAEIDLAKEGEKVKNNLKILKKAPIVLRVTVVLAIAIFFIANQEARYFVNVIASGGGVATSSMSQHGTEKLGVVFGDFFENPHWKSYKANGQKYVDFTGECEVWGSPAHVRLTFAVYDNSFKLIDCEIDGESVGALVGIAIISAAYD